MPREALDQGADAAVWHAKHVYSMAVVCLLLGLAIGYLFRGSQSLGIPAKAAASTPSPPASPNSRSRRTPTLDDMKQMADKKAAPLLEKLKSDSANFDLLVQVGNIYKATHQFKDAAGYYRKALQVSPKNVAIRTEFASCLFYDGDADGAIAQLQEALHYDPKDANSLLNLGMIKWQGKQDGQGALSAWQQLLKSNPQLGADRKTTVQKLMADVQSKSKS